MSHTMLYKSPGAHAINHAHAAEKVTYDHVVVEDADVAEHVKDGWFLTIPEAVKAAKAAEAKAGAAKKPAGIADLTK